MENTDLNLLYELVEPEPFPTDLTVGNFIDFTMNPNTIEEYVNDKTQLNIERLGLMKSIIQGVSDIIKQINIWSEKKFDDGNDDIRKRAALGVDFPTYQEQMLIDCVKYFNLKSLEEAENTRLFDYIIMKKSELANNKYEGNYSRLMEKKLKQS